MIKERKMNIKMNKEDIMKMSEIEIFNLCRENNYIFPAGFWTVINCKNILKYLYRNNEITKEELIRDGFRKSVMKFKISKLWSTISHYAVDCFKYMVDDKIKIWELPTAPTGYWHNHDNVKEYLLWYCEQQGWSEDEIPSKFKIANISKILTIHYSIKDIVKITFGDKYSIYQFNLPNNFWENKDNVREYVKYIIEEEHKLLTFDDVINNIRYDMFKPTPLAKYGLYGLLNIAYPGIYHKWHVSHPNITSLSEVKEYMLWYIKNILKLNDDELLEKLDYQMFPHHLVKKFTSKEILDATFKPDYYMWDFKKFKSIKISQDDVVEEYIEWLALRNNMTIQELSDKRTSIINGERYRNYNTYKKLLSTLDRMVSRQN